MRPSPTIFRRTIAAVVAAMALTFAAAAPADAAKIEYGIAPQTPLGDNDYRLMNEANVDLLRTFLPWEAVQAGRGDCTPTGGACNWTYFDQQIGPVAEEGLGTMVFLSGSAKFVSPNPNKPPTKKADRKAWGDFIGAAAARYGPGGEFWNGPYQAEHGSNAPVVPVTVWQIWNEPSSNQFFKPKPNAKKYAKILKEAAKGIRSFHKKAEIVLGGMFPDTGPKGIKIDKYLKQLYQVKKVEKSFDAVAIHPYSKKPKGISGQMNRTRKAMNKAGDKKAGIWVTELGYSSDGPTDAEVGLKSERAQAKALKQSFKLLKKGKRKWNVAGIIWFTWQDSNDPNICRFCQSAGLLTASGDLKPAYNQFQKATRP